jgi:arsenate reductase
MPHDKVKILFLCTGNSCRSQMAEGWARKLRGELVQVHSAGLEPHGLDPLAVRVMREAGVDISGQKSKRLHELLDHDFDVVITVCDSAYENCPVFPRPVRVVHHNFDDPPRLAAQLEDEEEILSHYRRVRDELREFVKTLPDAVI